MEFLRQNASDISIGARILGGFSGALIAAETLMVFRVLNIRESTQKVKNFVSNRQGADWRTFGEFMRSVTIWGGILGSGVIGATVLPEISPICCGVVNLALGIGLVDIINRRKEE